MFQISIISAIRSAAVAAALLGLVAVGVAVRDAAAPDGPSLGRGDDYATRHTAAVELSRLDDFGTRFTLEPVELGRLDDAGTRNTAVTPALGRLDDAGTRHVADAELGPDDDYGTRHGR